MDNKTRSSRQIRIHALPTEEMQKWLHEYDLAFLVSALVQAAKFEGESIEDIAVLEKAEDTLLKLKAVRS